MAEWGPHFPQNYHGFRLIFLKCDIDLFAGMDVQWKLKVTHHIKMIGPLSQLIQGRVFQAFSHR